MLLNISGYFSCLPGCFDLRTWKKSGLLTGLQLICQFFHCFVKMLFDFSFPYGEYGPAVINQCLPTFIILLHIPVELGFPEFCSGLRHGCFFTSLVPVPETAVYENHGFVSAENNIGCSRQLFYILSVDWYGKVLVGM